MRKIFTAAAIGSAMLLGPAILAQAAGTTTRDTMAQQREDVRANIKEKRDNIKDTREDIRSERKDIAKQHMDIVFMRLDAAVQRLTGISDRIASRIAKFKEHGVDVSKAETLFADAKTKLEKAKTDAATAKSQAQAVVTELSTLGTTTPGTIPASVKKLRDSVHTAIESIKAAHQAFVKVVVELKGKKDPKETATTTPQ